MAKLIKLTNSLLMYKRYVDPETTDRCDSSIHKIITEKEKNNISSELNLKLFSLC